MKWNNWPIDSITRGEMYWLGWYFVGGGASDGCMSSKSWTWILGNGIKWTCGTWMFIENILICLPLYLSLFFISIYIYLAVCLSLSFFYLKCIQMCFIRIQHYLPWDSYCYSNVSWLCYSHHRSSQRKHNFHWSHTQRLQTRGLHKFSWSGLLQAFYIVPHIENNKVYLAQQSRLDLRILFIRDLQKRFVLFF